MLRKYKSRHEYIDKLMDQTIVSYENNFERIKSQITMPFSRHYTAMLKFKDNIKKKENPLILDVGCGIGDESIVLNSMGFNVLGIDASKKMITIAKYQNKKYDGSASFILADVRSLPFHDNLFDGIWCSSFIHHIPPEHLVHILNKFKRILKDNGILFICARNLYDLSHIVKTIFHYFNFISVPVKFGEFMIDGRYYSCYKSSNVANKLRKLNFCILSIYYLISVGRFHIYAKIAK